MTMEIVSYDVTSSSNVTEHPLLCSTRTKAAASSSSDSGARISAEQIFGAVCMSLVTLTATLGNAVLLIVLLRTPHLRFQLSIIFVTNLCIIDLLAALIVQLVFIASHLYSSQPILGPDLAAAHGYVACVLMFASVFAICAISVERFYSIRLPMHHAANLTLGRACAVIIVYVWIQAVVLAVPPIRYSWNVFLYKFLYKYPTSQSNGQLCRVEYGGEPADYLYVFSVTLLCFIIPSVVVFAVYCSIYRVARQAASQVHPCLVPSYATRCQKNFIQGAFTGTEFARETCTTIINTETKSRRIKGDEENMSELQESRRENENESRD